MLVLSKINQPSTYSREPRLSRCQRPSPPLLWPSQSSGPGQSKGLELRHRTPARLVRSASRHGGGNDADPLLLCATDPNTTRDRGSMRGPGWFLVAEIPSLEDLFWRVACGNTADTILCLLRGFPS